MILEEYKDYKGYPLTDLDNKNSLYWLGFLASDGCIASNTNSIALELKSTDRNHLVKYKNFLKIDANLRENVREKNQKHIINSEIKTYLSVRIVFRSTKLKEFLISLGITPKKSLTLDVTNSILKNSKDFFRGLTDGDGHLGIYNINGSFYPTYSLVGSYKIIESFMHFCRDVIGIRTKAKICNKKSKNNGTYYVKFTHLIAYKIIKYLYDGAECYLDRKYEIAMKILEKFGEKYEKNLFKEKYSRFLSNPNYFKNQLFGFKERL